MQKENYDNNTFGYLSIAVFIVFLIMGISFIYAGYIIFLLSVPYVFIGIILIIIGLILGVFLSSLQENYDRQKELVNNSNETLDVIKSNLVTRELDAIKLLDIRYAKGEISTEEYNEMKKNIKD